MKLNMTRLSITTKTNKTQRFFDESSLFKAALSYKDGFASWIQIPIRNTDQHPGGYFFYNTSPNLPVVFEGNSHSSHPVLFQGHFIFEYWVLLKVS
jgi:hypothetical protein